VLAHLAAATVLGVDGHPVDVQVHVTNGLPSFTVVGLPDEVCRQARDRVRAALVCSGLKWPQSRITVNLAPSCLRKVGAALDLPIALALLVASDQLKAKYIDGLGAIGELGLDGSLRPVPGALSLIGAVQCARMVVPWGNAVELAALGRTGHPARSLVDVVAGLAGTAAWDVPPSLDGEVDAAVAFGLVGVRGQRQAQRALVAAAAGRHHVLMIGPPGAGKTLLARQLCSLLPPLDGALSLEASKVRSAAGLALPSSGLVTNPPMRSPHHSASVVALVGGGTSSLRPGEVSLAHGGVLFLDEVAEFPSAVLDALRQPLEEGVVHITRAKASADLPADVLLVAAMNPCPCGEATMPHACRCAWSARRRYVRRISGPLLDRFDLRVVVGRPSAEELLGEPVEIADLGQQVRAAQALARERQGCLNGAINHESLDAVAPLARDARSMLAKLIDQGRLSARGLHRIRRVARTLADLDGDLGPVSSGRVAEALSLRIDIQRLVEDAA
jgi:magnesium chelatase family protein